MHQAAEEKQTVLWQFALNLLQRAAMFQRVWVCFALHLGCLVPVPSRLSLCLPQRQIENFLLEKRFAEGVLGLSLSSQRGDSVLAVRFAWHREAVHVWG